MESADDIPSDLRRQVGAILRDDDGSFALAGSPSVELDHKRGGRDVGVLVTPLGSLRRTWSCHPNLWSRADSGGHLLTLTRPIIPAVSIQLRGRQRGL
jgi:hypothetical protein